MARLRTWRWWLFPILLWACATLYLGGDIGKWHDDYFFFSQLTPETGEPRELVLRQPLHFWRPVYRWIAAPLNTALFWNDQANHVITAAVHGLTSLVLCLLLLRLGVSRAVAAFSALAFMVYPVAFEVAFWNTVMFTSLATMVMLAALMLHLRWLDPPSNDRPCRWRWTIPPAIGLLTFISAGMNEQPAAMALAMPALALAALRSPADTRADAGGRARRLLVALLPSAFGAAAVAAYTAVHSSMFPPEHHGHSGAVVPLSDMPERLSWMLQDISSGLTLRWFAGGAWESGLNVLGRNWAIAGAWGGALVAAAAIWVASVSRVAPPRLPAVPAPTRTFALPPILVILLGAAIFAAPWLPIARIYYAVSPRLFYAPMTGLAIVLAGVLHLALAGAARVPSLTQPWLRVLLASLAACGLLACAVMMVGIQGAYQRRWQMDQRQAAQLRELVPNPEPGTIFLPLRVAGRPARPESSRFDNHFISPWTTYWAAGWYVQMAYTRSDVFCGIGAGRAGAGVSMVEPSQIQYGPGLAPPAPGAGRRAVEVAVDRILPLIIVPSGKIHLVTSLQLSRPDGRSTEILPPRTSRLGALPPRPFKVRREADETPSMTQKRRAAQPRREQTDTDRP